ncbi:MAG: RNA methyltransferase [Acidimicrobiia bacterium]|nr:RNA methyltransferase [Acidimicrobiia bacterium]
MQQLRRLLARRSARVEESAFVVEGAVLIGEAVRGGWDVLAQFVSGDAAPIAGCDAPVFTLGEGVLDRVASTDSPQPNLAVVSRRTASLARLEMTVAGSASWVMFLDAVSDPGNLGTILRSAVLGSGTVDPFNPKVVRASAGALFHVPVVEGASLAEVKALGYRVLATSSHEQVGSRRLAEADLDGAVCVVLGSEAHGVHAGRAESLNVAMAATIVSYELARARG